MKFQESNTRAQWQQSTVPVGVLHATLFNRLLGTKLEPASTAARNLIIDRSADPPQGPTRGDHELSPTTEGCDAPLDRYSGGVWRGVVIWGLFGDTLVGS